VRILERMYRSGLGRAMSFVARQIAWMHKPFMVYGYYDNSSRTFRKFTRISSDVVVVNRKALSIGDHVWVGYHSILDASNGITIEEGCQLAARVHIVTHGSHNSIRLLGSDNVHISNINRRGYVRGKVEIGAYTFIGTGSVILPGIKVGKGCLIGAGTVVTENVPDYSFVVGNPGRIKGSTIDIDKEFFRNDDFSATYYDSEALALVRKVSVRRSKNKE